MCKNKRPTLTTPLHPCSPPPNPKPNLMLRLLRAQPKTPIIHLQLLRQHLHLKRRHQQRRRIQNNPFRKMPPRTRRIPPAIRNPRALQPPYREERLLLFLFPTSNLPLLTTITTLSSRSLRRTRRNRPLIPLDVYIPPHRPAAHIRRVDDEPLRPKLVHGVFPPSRVPEPFVHV